MLVLVLENTSVSAIDASSSKKMCIGPRLVLVNRVASASARDASASKKMCMPNTVCKLVLVLENAIANKSCVWGQKLVLVNRDASASSSKKMCMGAKASASARDTSAFKRCVWGPKQVLVLDMLVLDNAIVFKRCV